MILDLFAGPGGWDVALRNLGLSPVIGIEQVGNAIPPGLAEAVLRAVA